MPVSVNQTLANTLGLADPLGRIADDGRVGFNGRVNINGRPIRFAPNFDGVDDYGVLANRAINPDGDNAIEFYSPASLSAFQVIISQNISSAAAAREFQLSYQNSTRSIDLTFGGQITVLCSEIDGYEAGKKYFLKLTGTSYTIAKNAESNIIKSGTFLKGAAREPSAQTVIGARTNGVIGSYSVFYIGIQRDIKINGVLWRMDQRNQAIQPSTPAGNNMTLVNVTSDRWQEVPQ